MFAIFDNIAGEWLTHFESGKDFWTGERYPESILTFPTKDKAQVVLDQIIEQFISAGEEINFSIVKVKERRYFERVER